MSSAVRVALGFLGVLAAAPPASAQVVYPPRAEKMDVHIRYRIRADRDERVRQFRVLQEFLKARGFAAAPRDDDDQDILDPNAERFVGTAPSAKVLSLLDDPRVKTILFAPAGHKYPDAADGMVPVRLGIATGYLAPDQQLLHRQVNELLAKLGFREAVGYDHRGYAVVRGAVPFANLFRLLKDLRNEPTGWFFLDPPDLPTEDQVPPVRARQPIRDTLPVRWVEVLPDADTTLLTPPPALPPLALYDPALREKLGDPKARDESMQVEVVYAANVEDKVDVFRNRLRADFPRAPKAGGGEYHAARIDGAVGNVLSVRFGRLVDMARYAMEPDPDEPRFAQEPRIIGLRLPRAGGETVASILGQPTNFSGDVLRGSRLETLHAMGYRGQGTRVVVIASGFPGAAEMVGKDLPHDTKLIDMTAELSPTLEASPPFANRESGGTAAARAAHLAAPHAQLILVRVNPLSLFQVATVAKLVRGDIKYSEAMESRIAELADQADAVRVKAAAAAAEYSEAFANLSDDVKPTARRKAAAAALAKIRLEEQDIATRFGRSDVLQKSLAVLDKANVVVNTLAWESGYPLDALSGLSQYIERSFAGDAGSAPRSRSATNPRAPFRPLWVQAASAMGGSVWAGPYLDADGNGAMEFTTGQGTVPAGAWTRELNFLAALATDGKATPNLVAGTRLRFSVQWRETHDPNIYAGRDAVFPLTIRVFRQGDPTGQKRASDELDEVARSVGEAQIVRKETNYGVYEQVVEMTVPADGRYAVRLDGRLAFDPRLPALKQHMEIQPRLLVESVGGTAEKGRPVFATFVPLLVGVGMPGDAKAALTVGATDKATGTTLFGAVGGGPGLALLQKPDLLAAGSIEAAGALGGPGVASGFGGGFAAVLLGSGAPASDLLKATGLQRGGPAVVPENWLRLLPPARP